MIELWEDNLDGTPKRKVAGYEHISMGTAIEILNRQAELHCNQSDSADFVEDGNRQEDDGTITHRRNVIAWSPYKYITVYRLKVI